MGKKRLRKKIVSAGKRRLIGVLSERAVKDSRSPLQAHVIKVESWARGQNPWLTIENPDKSQTNRKFIKVRANDYLGPWRISAKEAKAMGAEA